MCVRVSWKNVSVCVRKTPLHFSIARGAFEMGAVGAGRTRAKIHVGVKNCIVAVLFGEGEINRNINASLLNPNKF